MEVSKSVATGMAAATLIQPSKSPEAESDTPPRIQPMPFTNGVLKRHKHHHVVVSGLAYKECLKNHAANLGRHALDGCGEFMPAPSATSTDPTSLRCAACGCHRNFHRREPEELGGGGGGGGVVGTRVIEYHPHHRHHPLPPPGVNLSAPPQAVEACRVESPGSDNNSPPPISSTYYPGSAPHMLLTLSSGGDDPTNKTRTGTGTTNNIELQQHQIFGTPPQMPSRKRHRTKFSQQQKEKMYEFADKVGWKLVRSNEDLVISFCNEIGVERGVFKVWMHNNKNTLGKRSTSTTPASAPPVLNYDISANNHGGISIEDINDPIEEDDQHDDIHGNGVVIGNSHSSNITTNNNNNHHHHGQQYNNVRSIESINNVVTANASSSSS